MPHKKSLNQCPFLLFCTAADHIGLEACKAIMQAYYAFLDRFCCPKCGYSYTMSYPLFWSRHGHHAGYFRSAKAIVGNNIFQQPLVPVQPLVQQLPAVHSEVPAVQPQIVQVVQPVIAQAVVSSVQYAVVEEVPLVQAEQCTIMYNQLHVSHAEVVQVEPQMLYHQAPSVQMLVVHEAPEVRVIPQEEVVDHLVAQPDVVLPVPDMRNVSEEHFAIPEIRLPVLYPEPVRHRSVTVGTMTLPEMVTVSTNTVPTPMCMGTMTDPTPVIRRQWMTVFKKESRVIIELSDDEEELGVPTPIISTMGISSVGILSESVDEDSYQQLRNDMFLTPSISYGTPRDMEPGSQQMDLVSQQTNSSSSSSSDTSSSASTLSDPAFRIPIPPPPASPSVASSSQLAAFAKLKKTLQKVRPIHTNPVNWAPMDNRMVSLGRQIIKRNAFLPSGLGPDLKRLTYVPSFHGSTTDEDVKEEKVAVKKPKI